MSRSPHELPDRGLREERVREDNLLEEDVLREIPSWAISSGG
ncbi:protein of unknown function [Cyanobium sp. NIES-981]|nr:protein of unknown function [Cyanobium sp. NIES-981]SBO44779.1 protein of unknown function [Cyanobium sp. NIES-981]